MQLLAGKPNNDRCFKEISESRKIFKFQRRLVRSMSSFKTPRTDKHCKQFKNATYRGLILDAIREVLRRRKFGLDSDRAAEQESLTDADDASCSVVQGQGAVYYVHAVHLPKVDTRSHKYEPGNQRYTLNDSTTEFAIRLLL